MINSDSMPPSATTDTLFDLLKLIADPKGASKRLSELLQACQDANAATSALHEKSRKMSSEELGFKRSLDSVREQHDLAIQTSLAAHERRIEDANTAWSRREEAVALRETTVAQREQAAEERHQDLHRRLNLLKQAASPAE
jgi:hypothetical protein